MYEYDKLIRFVEQHAVADDELRRKNLALRFCSEAFYDGRTFDDVPSLQEISVELLEEIYEELLHFDVLEGESSSFYMYNEETHVYALNYWCGISDTLEWKKKHVPKNMRGYM